MSLTNLDIQYRKELELESSKTGTGWSQWGLAIAKVLYVDYEFHTVTLQMITGNPENKELAPLPITYAGGGRRSFLGIMPSKGDYCVVGWISSNSSGQASAKRPMILSWFPPPPGLAKEWMAAQEFEPGEGMDTLTMRKQLGGAAIRTRFKLRHMEPGMVVASSSKGSDLVLDESAALVNRRGNEIRLRDQDQTLVTRSIATHMAMSGTRVYAGPIQRDANILPKDMFDDLTHYQTTDISNFETAVLSMGWDEDYGYRGKEYLTPANVFKRDEDGDNLFALEGNGLDWEELDPFNFLQLGGFIDEDGELHDAKIDGVSCYGGRSFFRFGQIIDAPSKPTGTIYDAAAVAGASSLPEFRVEVEQEADLTLPVTEGTDGIDVDRLPAAKDVIDLPLVEFVLGTVVGNDFYNEPDNYGKPLVPKIKGGVGTLKAADNNKLGEQAATLLKVNPAVPTETSTWISVRKDGKVIANLSNGLEVFVRNGYKFSTASPLDVESTQKTRVRSTGPDGGVDIEAPQAAVTIIGMEPKKEGSVMNMESEAEESQAKDAPSVDIQSPKGSTRLQAGNNIDITAQSKVRIKDTKALDVEAKDKISLISGSKNTISGKNGEYFTTSTSTFTHTGGSPLDGPCRKVSIPCTPATGAVAHVLDQDVKEIQMGSEKTTVQMGNCNVRRNIGDCTDIIGLGIRKDMVGANVVQHSVGGWQNTQAVGVISMTAAAGAISQTSTTAISSSTSGANTSVASVHTVTAPGNAAAPGSPVTQTSRCPITGIPFGALTNCATGMVFG